LQLGREEQQQLRSISLASTIPVAMEHWSRSFSKQVPLTDEILDLHDRFVGSIFNKARRRRDEALSDFHRISPAEGPTQLTWMPVTREFAATNDWKPL
jgi:hypothetical protein